jgi:hypothetical protein
VTFSAIKLRRSPTQQRHPTTRCDSFVFNLFKMAANSLVTL